MHCYKSVRAEMTVEGGGGEDAGRELGDSEEEEGGGAGPEEGLHQEPHLPDEQAEEEGAARSVLPVAPQRQFSNWKI